MDWQECLNRRIAKEVNKDVELMNSLIKASKNKLDSSDKLEISEITAASKLSLAYDSLREVLEVLALQEGYKIYNHEGYTAFLKEVVREISEGEEFDEIRQIRNQVNYYGKNISIDEAEKIIKRIVKMRASIIKKIKEIN